MTTTKTERNTANEGSASPPAIEGVVHIEDGPNGTAILRLGAASERVVTLTAVRLDSLDRAIAELSTRSELRGVIVTGPGPAMFAAGADIKMIEDITDPAVGAAGARRGQEIFAALEALQVPVVAAIDGPCVGGALELALGCGVRVATDMGHTTIGLPEVKLGIVPGFGGTQRLSRLVGLPKALDAILKGKLMRPTQARRAGVVDRVVPQAKLMAAASQEIEKLVARRQRAPKRSLRGGAFWFSRCAPLRSLVARKVGKTLSSGPARFYDAPKRALELCLDAFRLAPAEGYAREAEELGKLIASPTSKGLVRLYFLTERAKRLGKAEGAAHIERALVVGGGVMGAGIAGSFAGKGITTRLCDLSRDNLLRAKQRLAKSLGKKLRRRHIEKHQAQAVQDRLAVSDEWGSLASADLLLEAVPEILDLKRKLFREAVDRGLADTATIATNTSSLSIDAMSEGVPTPERVVGIHFFNPPEKMPLVEVIRGSVTSDAAVATACRLAVRLGKFPVVVGDAPGFLVNRCLAPYINEAARLMVEGNSPESIDQVMLDFGLPMGPARLLDEVGYDVANKVSEVLAEAYSDRMAPSPFFAAMVESGHLGQKTPQGGLYGPDGKSPGPGRGVLKSLCTARGGADRLATRTEVHQRLLYPMIAEAFRILDEGLVAAEEDLDLGLVFGIGFPPFTGGITRYARAQGLAAIADAMVELAQRHGARFTPPAALLDRR